MNALLELISLEKELEQSKINIAQRPDFNIIDAFSIFDPSKRGTLSISEVKDGLAAIGVYPTSEELELVFKRYDVDYNERLTFKEFEAMWLPYDPHYSQHLIMRPSNHRVKQFKRDDCFFADT